MEIADQFQHRPPSRLQGWLNQTYNLWVLHRLRATASDDFGIPDSDETSLFNDPTPHVLVWLLNLRKSLSAITKHEGTLSEVTFMDLGAGSGVPVIYARKNFEFKEYIGIEIQTRLIYNARRNLELARCNKNSVHFILGDVGIISLEHRRHVLFCFNPFGVDTMREFLRNNLQVLNSTSSYMILINDRLLITVLEITQTTLLWRDPKRNSSIIRFGS